MGVEQVAINRSSVLLPSGQGFWWAVILVCSYLVGRGPSVKLPGGQ